MAGFGGTIKLQGEQAYRAALKAIAADLKNVAAEQKLTASTYDKTDTSLSALSKRSEDLKSKLASQEAKWNTLSKALKDYQTQQDKNKSTIQSVQAQLDKEKAKLEDVARQYGTNSKEYQTQAKVVDELEQQLKELNAQYDKNEVTLKNTQAALTGTEADMRKTKNEMQKLGDQAQKAGDNTDELGNSARDAAKKAQEAAQGGFTVMKGILADLSARVIATAVNGLKKLGGALINTGKQALESYGEYEQLVGGVETLFKDSAKTVQDYAAVAYKTAGMTANEYMSTVTSFSASLLQGLGGDTAKAAKIADMAILDMSDNANKMGTSIEMIQNAYQGFAKQNFTMLDNLKLGYGGTQAEMARLVNETGVMGKKFKATAKNIKEVPFDKLIEAIHKTQEKMGITGTTAQEASKTIQGSVNSMKSAWGNLLTAIADNNADLGKSVNEFVDSAITAGENVIPRVRIIIDGVKKLVGTLISDVFPKLKKEMPELTPIIEPLEWIIKNYRLIVTAISAILAAFVAAKVAKFASEIVGLISNFQKAAKEAGSLAKALTTMNFAQMANPIGIFVGALAGIGVAIAGVIDNMKNADSEAAEFSRHLEEQTEAVNANKEAYDELSKSVQDALNADMTSLQNVTNLKNELLQLVDANGKVKKGYEGRVQFILGELNNALGTEYKMTDGVIKKYDDLKKSIDSVIEKKKAEAIINAQQQLYQEAITKQAEAYQELDRIKEDLAGRETARQNMLDDLEALRNDNQNGRHNEQILRLQSEMAKYDEETANIQSNYDTQLDLLDKYAYDKATYEKNMELFHKEQYDKMTTVSWEYVKNQKKAGQDEISQLTQQNKDIDSKLKHLQELKKKHNTDIYDNDIKAYQEQKKANEARMKDLTSTTETELEKNVKTWRKKLGDQIKEIADKNPEFKAEAEGLIQKYIDGLGIKEPDAKAEMEKFAKDMVKEISKKKSDAKGAGENLIDGVKKGVNNQDKQSGVFSAISNFGSSLLKKLKSSLKEKSPSKATEEMGRFLLEGLGIGVDKEEASTLKQMQSFGEGAINALNAGLNSAIDTSNIANFKNALPEEMSANITANTSDLARASQINEDSMVSAFKTALSQMKIEMDDQEMGNFVDRTVSRRIFS